MNRSCRVLGLLGWLVLTLVGSSIATSCPEVKLTSPQLLRPRGVGPNVGKIFFGHFIKINAPWMVIGAYGLDNYAGSAFMYKLEAGMWRQKQILKAKTRSNGDHYGLSCAIGQGAVVVGKPFDNMDGPKSGSAEVFSLVGNKWVRSQILKPPGDGYGHADAWYGYGTAADGNMIAIGARYQHRLDKDGNIKQRRAGVVYIYKRRGAAGSKYQLLQILNGPLEFESFYGDEVRLSGFSNDSGRQQLLVGAPRHSPKEYGAVYVYFTRDGKFYLRNILKPKEPADHETNRDIGAHFGEGLAVWKQWLLTGGEQAASEEGRRTGNVYSYEYRSTGYKQMDILNPPRGASDRSMHGQRIGVENGVAAVGQWKNDVRGFKQAGSFTVYSVCSDGRWTKGEKYSIGMPAAMDNFGKMVDVRDGFIAVGAPFRETSPGSGARDRGGVYVYKYRV